MARLLKKTDLLQPYKPTDNAVLLIPSIAKIIVLWDILTLQQPLSILARKHIE